MAADAATQAAVVGGVVSAALGLLGVLGKRYEGRESRAVSTQSAVIDDLESSNTRLRQERDEARDALAEEVRRRQGVERLLADAEERLGVPHRRRTDQRREVYP